MAYKGNRIGLLTTLAFHLGVLIILLIASIRTVASQESSFVLDFTKQEEIEKIQKEIELKEEISRQLDEMIASSGREQVRNVAVDAGQRLKDDRFKNPNEVYDEARELQRRLDANRRDALKRAEEDQDLVETDSRKKTDDNANSAPAYKGPSVISWTLEGRKALSLPVPAYKGFGGGDVTVAIVVNKKGRVTAARVVESLSTADSQLHAFALDAARKSRFSASSDAPDKQEGEIVYRFLAQ